MPETEQMGRHAAYELDERVVEAWQWGDPVLRNVTELLLAAVRGSRGRALDVGCGTGPAAVAMARLGLAVDALDIDPKAVGIARSMGERLGAPINWEVGDFLESHPRYEDHAYDIVVCIEVLEHVEAWRDMVVHLRRVLKPGGLLFLTVPHDPRQFSVLDEYAGHLRRFRREEVLAALSGLEVDAYTVGFPSFRLIVWVYDRALRVSGRPHSAARLQVGGRLRSLVPRLMYALTKFDNRFRRLGLGTTLVVQARKPADLAQPSP